MKVRPTTVFAWPHKEGPSWTLLVMIFAMLLLHSSAFFLFQTVTPDLKPPPRMAPPIQLITTYGPDGTFSPENESLLRWLDSVDPALVARVPNVLPKSLLDIPYRKSFSTIRTAPLDLPPEMASVQFPPARDPMALILGSANPAPDPAPKARPQPTIVSFAAPLAARAPTVDFHPKGRSTKPLDATRLLIGVTGEGEVRFVFPQGQEHRETSPLDTEAAEFVSTLAFQPAPGQPIAWGMATVAWGDDITAEP